MKFHKPTLYVGLALNCLSAILRYMTDYMEVADILLVISLLVIAASYSLAIIGLVLMAVSFVPSTYTDEQLLSSFILFMFGSTLLVYSWKRTQQKELVSKVTVRLGRYRRIRRQMGRQRS